LIKFGEGFHLRIEFRVKRMKGKKPPRKKKARWGGFYWNFKL